MSRERQAAIKRIGAIIDRIDILGAKVQAIQDDIKEYSLNPKGNLITSKHKCYQCGKTEKWMAENPYQMRDTVYCMEHFDIMHAERVGLQKMRYLS